MSEEDYILIRKYLTGHLEDELKVPFEQRMARDDTFGATVEQFGKLMNGRTNQVIFDANEEEFLEPLDEELRSNLRDESALTQEMFAKLDSAKSPNTSHPITSPMSAIVGDWRTIAASVVLFLTAGIIYFNQPDNDEKLFTAIETEVNAPLGVLGVYGDNENEWREYYNNELYAQVIESLVSVDNRTSEQQLYLGLSYLYLEQHEKALQALKDDKLSDSKYAEYSRWYLSLAMYLSGDRDDVKLLWEEISKDEGAFRAAEAEEMIELLYDE